MTKTPLIDFTTFSIQKIKETKKRNFIFNEAYQRSSVWNVKQKQRLIDSIIRGYPIGSLVLREISSNKYEVLDGQQRVRTIFDFLENILQTPPEALHNTENKFFKNLKGNYYANFIAFPISVTLLKSGEEQYISEIFTRLQEGVPLNTAEKLNAYTIGGLMRKFVIDTTEHKLFKKIDIKNHRFSHREICASISLLELNSDFNIRDFPSLRFKNMANLYKEYKDKLQKTLKKKINRVLTFIYKAIGSEAKLYITNKSDFIQIYILVSFLLKNFYIDKNVFRKFLLHFLKNVEDINSGVPFNKYRDLRGKGQTKENLKARFNIMDKELHKTTKLKHLPESRLFDKSQKKQIYANANGKCEYKNCKLRKKVHPSNASYHHKKKYVSGGPTKVENGVLMHKKCHINYHKKYGY